MPAEAGKSHSTSSFRPLTIVAEGSLWDRFNQRHLGLKLTRIAKQRDTQTRKETNSIHLQQNPMGQAFILEQLAIQIEHLRKVPEQAYNAACEVWKKQGEKKTPEFVQVMFNKVILPTIQGRTTGIWQEFQSYAAAGGLPESDATFRAGRLRLGKAVEEVCEDWRINAEEEMLQLGYKEAGGTSKGTERRTPQKKAPRRKERKGDSTLLRGKDAVTFRTAEQYLGISRESPVGGWSDSSLEMVFIRAPIIERVGPGVQVLAECRGSAVLVRQQYLLAATFHPELTPDPRLHQYFLTMVEGR